jgi:transcriptional regulator with XRE-family HTH domain
MPKSIRKDPWAVEFGAFVQRLRKERHWTIAELARRMQHTPTWVSILEKGDNLPSMLALRWLGSAFGMRASELLRQFEDEQIARNAPAEKNAS